MGPPRGNDRVKAALAFALACLLPLPAWAARPGFAVDYRVAFAPENGTAHVVIATAPIDGRLVRLKARLDPDRYTGLKADGTLERDGDEVTWSPPRKGGTLQYRVRVDHRRRGDGYDARMTGDWALLRGDDLVPPLQSVVTRGADARARLRFALPEGWTIETPYSRSRDGNSYVIVDPERRVDRPEGWILAGRLGVRRDRVAGMRVAVAAPRGEGVRRNDLLAFVNALAPQLGKAFGELPPRLLVVQAGDPMWRGGLSGPRSLYLHAGRPMLSGNGTSTPAHELVHVVTRLRGAEDDDWIVEGLAEYYAIELPRRAGLLTASRRGKALAWMRERGASVKALRTDRSKDRVTARAVVLFAALDAEISKASDGERNLDAVVRRLIPQREVSREALRDAARAVLGRPSDTLQTPLLD
jgi:predicted metalloprotease with PDZ domain